MNHLLHPNEIIDYRFITHMIVSLLITVTHCIHVQIMGIENEGAFERKPQIALVTDRRVLLFLFR